MYAANDPVKYVDYNGEFPMVLAAPLIYKGTVAAIGAVGTAIAVYQARENYKNQQKRETAIKKEKERLVREFKEIVDKHVGKPTPDGSGTPTGGGNTLAKVIVGVGSSAAVIHLADETINRDNENNTDNQSSDQVRETSIGEASNNETENSGQETNIQLPIPTTTLPVDNTRVIINRRYD